MLLWVVVDEDMKPWGYVITEIREFPKCKVLTVQYCAGQEGYMTYIEKDMYETLENFARDADCAGIEFIGRRGWEKHVKKYGYTAGAVVYERFFNVEKQS